jgi:hypothetical protein
MFHFISIYLTPFMHWLSYHHAILFVIIDYGEIPVVGLKNDKQNQEFCNSGPMYLIAACLFVGDGTSKVERVSESMRPASCTSNLLNLFPLV